MPFLATESTLADIAKKLDKRADARREKEIYALKQQFTQFITRHVVNHEWQTLAIDIENILNNVSKMSVESFRREEIERFMKQVAEIEAVTEK